MDRCVRRGYSTSSRSSILFQDQFFLSRCPFYPPGWNAVELGPEGNGTYRLLRGVNRGLVERFNLACQDPESAEQQVLERVLQTTRGSEVGRRFKLPKVTNIGELREQVPIRTHQDHRDDLRRVAGGEACVVTTEPVLSMVKTSGTTGEPKLLPVTRSWARACRDSSTLWVLAMLREDEDLRKGKALTSVGAEGEGVTSGGLRFGSNTGRIAASQPWLVRKRYAVPLDCFAIPEVEVRQYCLLRLALNQPVQSWTTANPSTILAMSRLVERWREPLMRDLSDRTLCHGPASELPSSLRRRWRWRLRRRVLLPADNEPWLLAQHWKLRSINCWKGGMAPFFIEQFKSVLGADVPVRGVGISASEGVFGIPLHSSWSGSVFWPNGHLIEFVSTEGGEPLSAHQLGIGKEYRLIITTSAGLLRYDMNDIVKVRGWHGALPLLSFERKSGDFSSVVGEKVSANQVISAFCELTIGSVGFAVGVEMSAQPTYILFVEANEDLPPDLASHFDAALSRLNGEYRSKRETARLSPPTVVQVARGTFERYRMERVNAGAVDGQVKDPVFFRGEEIVLVQNGWRR